MVIDKIKNFGVSWFNRGKRTDHIYLGLEVVVTMLIEISGVEKFKKWVIIKKLKVGKLSHLAERNWVTDMNICWVSENWSRVV